MAADSAVTSKINKILPGLWKSGKANTFAVVLHGIYPMISLISKEAPIPQPFFNPTIAMASVRLDCRDELISESDDGLQVDHHRAGIAFDRKPNSRDLHWITNQTGKKC